MTFLCTCVLSLQQKVVSQVHMNSSANIVQQNNKLITWLQLEKDQLMLKLESAIQHATKNRGMILRMLILTRCVKSHLYLPLYRILRTLLYQPTWTSYFCYFWFWAGCRPYEELYIEDSAVGGWTDAAKTLHYLQKWFTWSDCHG